MKDILVMGGRRFVGKKLVNLLVELGYNVSVANRSGISESDVHCISFDRNDKNSVKEKLGGHYDVIYDMISYSPENAKALVGNIDAGKYIMVSSSVVYDWGKSLSEDDFIAEEYELIEGDIESLGKRFGYKQGYKLGKMGAEHVVATMLGIPSIRVRFPIIMGDGDHTKRIETYVKSIINHNSIYIDNLCSEFSVISASNAAKFLTAMVNSDYIGAINCADEGYVSIMDIISRIEEQTGNKCIYNELGVNGGYNGYYSCILSIERMKLIGLETESINKWFYKLVENICRNEANE